MAYTSLDKLFSLGTAAERAAFTPDPPAGVLTLWHETDTGQTHAWDGSAWSALAGGGGSVASTDITDSTPAGRALLTGANAAAQRTSLGLGTAATTSATAYATAAQGAKADSALQVTTVTYAAMLALTGMAAGDICQVSDVGPARSLWCYDGTRWRPMGGRASVRSLPASAVGSASASEQILDQVTIPAKLLHKAGDRLALKLAYEKSGNADTLQFRVRIGVSGTTSDTILFSSGALTGANKSVGALKDFRRLNATTMQHLGAVGSTTVATGLAAFSGTQASQQALSVTVPDLDAAPLIITISAQMSAGTEAPTLQALEIALECA